MRINQTTCTIFPSYANFFKHDEFYTLLVVILTSLQKEKKVNVM